MTSFHCSMRFVIGHNWNRQLQGTHLPRGAANVSNWNRYKGLLSTWIAYPSEGKGIHTLEAVVKTNTNHRPHRQRSKGGAMRHLITAKNRPTASLTTAIIEFWTLAAISSSTIHNQWVRGSNPRHCAGLLLDLIHHHSHTLIHRPCNPVGPSHEHPALSPIMYQYSTPPIPHLWKSLTASPSVLVLDASSHSHCIPYIFMDR